MINNRISVSILKLKKMLFSIIIGEEKDFLHLFVILLQFQRIEEMAVESSKPLRCSPFVRQD